MSGSNYEAELKSYTRYTELIAKQEDCQSCQEYMKYCKDVICNTSVYNVRLTNFIDAIVPIYRNFYEHCGYKNEHTIEHLGAMVRAILAKGMGTPDECYCLTLENLPIRQELRDLLDKLNDGSQLALFKAIRQLDDMSTLDDDPFLWKNMKRKVKKVIKKQKKASRKATIKELNDTVSSLDLEHLRLISNNTVLHARFTELNIINGELNSQLATLRSEYEKSAEKIMKLENDCVGYEQDIGSLETTRKTLAAELAATRKKLEETDEELRSQNAIPAKLNQIIEQQRTQLAELQTKYDSLLSKTVEYMQNKVKQPEEFINTYDELNNKIHNLTLDNTAKAHIIANLEKIYGERSAELSEAFIRISELEKSEKQLKQELEKATSELCTFEKAYKIDSQVTSAEKIQDAQRIQELNSKINYQAVQIAFKDETISGLETSFRECSNELTKAKSRISELEKSEKQLKHELDLACDKLAGYKSAVDDSEYYEKQLKETVESSANKIVSLELQLSTLGERYEHLATERDSLQYQLAQLQQSSKEQEVQTTECLQAKKVLEERLRAILSNC